MNKLKALPISLALVSAIAVTGCATTENGEVDPNASAKTGAVGGALLGLVMGAAAGDASLAVKGAAVGAAAGGVSGAMVDIENAREDRRTEVTADAISQPSTVVVNGESAAQKDNGDYLDSLVGEWQVSIWALDKEGQELQATAIANGQLRSRSQVDLEIDIQQVNGEAQQARVTSAFAFDEQQGHSMSIDSSLLEQPLGLSGEYQAQMNRFNYYANNAGAQGRVEMRIINDNMWLVENYQLVNGQEVLTQSYRFNRG